MEQGKSTQNHINKHKDPIQNRKWLLPTVILSAAVVLIAVIIIVSRDSGDNGKVSVIKDQDLVIPISEISATAQFYPVEIDNTRLEVIAVKAPDGTIRTAFNTCQVCYSSGKGYYKQEGDKLVCQNCGNRFKMDQVEVQSGGCNPDPIFPENKTVTDESITISKDYLAQTKAIFANWKVEY